ncbi:MAG: 2-oxoacid:acceptor oxidoreductase family protein [Candidatus Latescibacteria bacterium]|nr:2-oxoacid:acceptor oxidoreductase family protein [Candidatus Latescibacterota bacterium]
MGIKSETSPDTQVLIAGHGGQGVIFMGTLLAHAAMLEGKEVTFFPSYGAEMRGGTAHASVVVSTRRIASPIVAEPDILIVLNEPSLLRFENRVRPNGRLFFNSSLIVSSPSRDDLDVIPVAATELAQKLGNPRTVNMVMLGTVARITGLVALSTLSESLETVLPAHRKNLLEQNRQALQMADCGLRNAD